MCKTSAISIPCGPLSRIRKEVAFHKLNFLSHFCNGSSVNTDQILFCFLGQYPTQPSYPVQPPGNPVYPQTMPLPQAPPYTDAPPAYSELYRPSFVHPGAATVPTMSAAYPGASLYLPMAQSVAVGPMGSSVPMAYYPVGPVYPPGSTVLVEGGFDAGARFGAGATGSVPPPPPGCPPNAAQLAAMQGANVLVTQRKGSYFMGGSDGGYTIW
uniref:DAZ-associated protein 2 n=1 Tax=Chrysemys picta bellii TaxID=8478 RepID=A0A8C3HZS9_CHRPI